MVKTANSGENSGENQGPLALNADLPDSGGKLIYNFNLLFNI